MVISEFQKHVDFPCYWTLVLEEPRRQMIPLVLTFVFFIILHFFKEKV